MKTNVWIINHYAGDTYFDKGGRHFWIAKYLAKLGYKPVVFCCNNKHNPGTEKWIETEKLWVEQIEPEINVPYVFVKGRKYIGNGKRRILNMMDFYINVKKTIKQYAKMYGKPDIIYASSVHPLSLVAGLQLARKYKVKCICEIRDLWPEALIVYGVLSMNNPIVKILRLIEKKIYTKADKIIFTAAGEFNYILDQKWDRFIPAKKLVYVNNGIDIEAFDINLRNYPYEDSQLNDSSYCNIVYAGSIRKVNDVGRIIDIAKEIKNKRIRFLIWGDGDQVADLQRRISEEDITNVFLKGRVAKCYIPSITSKATINFVHNSPSPMFKYGLSFNKIFDYLAAGKPIICDFHSDFNPVILGGAGIEISSSNPREVATEIEKFTEKSAQEKEKYCKAAIKAAREYDVRKLTSLIATTIEEL